MMQLQIVTCCSDELINFDSSCINRFSDLINALMVVWQAYLSELNNFGCASEDVQEKIAFFTIQSSSKSKTKLNMTFKQRVELLLFNQSQCKSAQKCGTPRVMLINICCQKLIWKTVSPIETMIIPSILVDILHRPCLIIVLNWLMNAVVQEIRIMFTIFAIALVIAADAAQGRLLLLLLLLLLL